MQKDAAPPDPGPSRDPGAAVRTLTPAEAAADASLRAGTGIDAERLRCAVQLSWDMIMLMDASTRVEYANEAVERILGYAQEEFVGQDALSFVHPDDLEPTRKLHAEVLGHPGQSMIADLRVRHRDGSWRWTEIAARNLLDNPSVRAIVVSARDSTELRQQRQAAEQAHQDALVFRHMVERASQAIGTADLDARVLYQNPPMLRLLGLASLEHARQHTFEDFYRPEDLRYLRQVVIPEVLTRGHWTGEIVLQPLGREPVSTIHSVYLLRDEAGRPYAFSNVVTDISDQKQVERDLRASETKYRQLFEQSLDGIVLAELASGRIVDCNEALCRMSGRSRGELIGQPQDSLHRIPDMARRSAPSVAENCPDGGAQVLDEQLITAAGQVLDVEIKCNVIDLDGKALRQSIYRDVTQRKQAEAALERRIVALTRPLDASEGISFEDLFNIADIQRLQDLIASAFGVASMITKPDGTPITAPSNFTEFCAGIVRATPRGLAHCTQSDAVVGRNNPDGPNVQHCLSAGLCNAGASISVGGHHVANWLIGQVRDETQDEESILRFADDIGADTASFLAAFRKVPAMPREQFEKVAQVLFAVARRLSDSAYQNVQQARFIWERDQAEARRKELEMALRQRQHELERFARLDLLNGIASGLAHELNQPIAAAQYLLSACQRIVRSAVLSQADMSQILGDVYAQMERMAKIVEQISGMSRQRRSNASRLNVATLLKECLSFLDFEFRRSGISISLDVHDEVPEITADPIRIQQSVLILLQNAIESIRSVHGSGGHVALGAAVRDQAVEIRVRDDGAGFSPDALQHLFLPFFTTKDGGMGLGLPICHAIIDEYGGQLIAQNNAEAGATVRFTLPAD